MSANKFSHCTHICYAKELFFLVFGYLFAYPCERVRPVQGPKSPKSGKEGLGVKTSHFPVPQKWALWVKKTHFSTGLHKENGDFLGSKRPFLGHWGMGVFRPRNPLLPILVILTPVGGGRVRKPIPFCLPLLLAPFSGTVIIASQRNRKLFSTATTCLSMSSIESKLPLVRSSSLKGQQGWHVSHDSNELRPRRPATE